MNGRNLRIYSCSFPNPNWRCFVVFVKIVCSLHKRRPKKSFVITRSDQVNSIERLISRITGSSLLRIESCILWLYAGNSKAHHLVTEYDSELSLTQSLIQEAHTKKKKKKKIMQILDSTDREEKTELINFYVSI